MCKIKDANIKGFTTCNQPYIYLLKMLQSYLDTPGNPTEASTTGPEDRGWQYGGGLLWEHNDVQQHGTRVVWRHLLLVKRIETIAAALGGCLVCVWTEMWSSSLSEAVFFTQGSHRQGKLKLFFLSRKSPKKFWENICFRYLAYASATECWFFTRWFYWRSSY